MVARTPTLSTAEQNALTQLRKDLLATDFRAATVHRRLGASAESARLEGVFAPALHALTGGPDGALEQQIRLLLLGCEVTRQEFEAGFTHLKIEDAQQLGLISESETQTIRATYALEPISLDHPRATEAGHQLDLWLLSDLGDAARQGPAARNHVMGVGAATRALLTLAPLPPAELVAEKSRRSRALDLGTGCGVVALVLAHAGYAEVVATDISPRALKFAAMNVFLNLPDHGDVVQLREGSLFEPVAGESFDLVLSNPPFVITPQLSLEASGYEYRSGTFEADTLAAHIALHAANYLLPGGEFVCLANWEHRWGEDGLERVRRWFEAPITEPTVGAMVEPEPELATDFDAWVIERERVAPAQYAMLWARDGGARVGSVEHGRALTAWLEDFASRRVVSVGLGSIRLIRRQPAHAPANHIDEVGGSPTVRTESLAGAIGSGAGHELSAVLTLGTQVQQLSDTQLLERAWVRAAGVTELRKHEPGEESPWAITLEKLAPVQRVVTADTLLAAAIGACDGDLTLGQICDALATLLEADSEAVSEALCLGVRELVWMGMLHMGE